MNSARQASRELSSVLASGGRAVLATIVRTNGSTYRKAGAELVVLANGDAFGLLSGGCLESLIAKEAHDVLATGAPRVLTFDLTGDEEYLIGYGKGCMGQVWIMLEPITSQTNAARRRLLAQLADTPEDLGVALVYEADAGAGVSAGARVVVDAANAAASDIVGPKALADELARAARTALATGKPGGGELQHSGATVKFATFVRHAPIELLLFGAGLDAQPVAAFAGQLGWNVRVFDHRPAFVRPERFPLARSITHFTAEQINEIAASRAPGAAVIMTHNLLIDAEVMAWTARQEQLSYVGLLGPAARRERILRHLDEDGRPVRGDLEGRLRSPIGLDLGGAGEFAIALAIVAEIQKLHHRRGGGHISDEGQTL